MISVVLFDLDGVIRHFDPRRVVDIERRHGLAVGALELVAFESPLIEDVTTGRISRAEWIRQLGDAVGSAPAAEEWGVQPARVDEDLLALADEVRGLGLRTAVLTNGTDSIRDEIAAMGIAGRFDAVFNSAEIGFVKPDARAFQHVLRALDVAAEHVFFTDDSASKLTGARRLGMQTCLFDDVETLRDELVRSGVHVSAGRSKPGS